MDKLRYIADGRSKGVPARFVEAYRKIEKGGDINRIETSVDKRDLAMLAVTLRGTLTDEEVVKMGGFKDESERKLYVTQWRKMVKEELAHESTLSKVTKELSGNRNLLVSSDVEVTSSTTVFKARYSSGETSSGLYTL